jgi:hypothetical protein
MWRQDPTVPQSALGRGTRADLIANAPSNELEFPSGSVRVSEEDLISSRAECYPRDEPVLSICQEASVRAIPNLVEFLFNRLPFYHRPLKLPSALIARPMVDRLQLPFTGTVT